MLEGWRLQDRRPFAICERIAERIGSDPSSVALAWDHGSTARTEAQRAGEIVGLGLWFLQIVADQTMAERTRPFYKAIDTEVGERAAVWTAHCLGRQFPNAPARPVFEAAYRLLQEHFPLTPEDDDALGRIVAGGHDDYGFDPRNIYGELTFHAMGLVLGSEVQDLPCFIPAHGYSQYELDLTFTALWGKGNRMYFKLIDPSGYADWAMDKDLAPSDLPSPGAVRDISQSQSSERRSPLASDDIDVACPECGKLYRTREQMESHLTSQHAGAT